MASANILVLALFFVSTFHTVCPFDTYSIIHMAMEENEGKEAETSKNLKSSNFSPLRPEVQKESDAMLTYLARASRTSDEPHFPNGLTCEICEFLVHEIRSLVQASQTIEELLAGISEACSITHLTSRDICRMVIHEYQEQILYIFNHLVLSPKEVCGLILGKGCETPYYPGQMWHVKFPETPKPPPKAPTVPQAGAPTMRFLQLTDIHLDPLYEQGAKAGCRDPLCCRDTSRKETILDVLINKFTTSVIAGKYGAYSQCDLPIVTARDLFSHLRSIQDQYDYILFTGDIPPHDVWNQSRSDQTTSIKLLDSLFQEFLPNKPLYQAVGNHEGVPCNSFPPPGIPNHNSSWLFDTLVDVWGRWVPRREIKAVAKCGSYSYSPFPGFRIISLNNNYCNTLNFWLLLNATDPCGSLQWLIQELQTAENKGEKVHLQLHIPPGAANCMKAWSWNFYAIISRYENTVVNQFYGHDHRDYFTIYLDDQHFQRATGVGFAAPSVTSYSDTNPAFRIYTMDGNYSGSSWAVLDYTTYYLNITEANEIGKPVWRPEYSPKKDLGMTGLYAADWLDLIKRMETDDALFQRFHRYYQVLNTVERCQGGCKKDLICKLKEGRSYDPKLCDDHKNH